jgi:hypothetical protein
MFLRAFKYCIHLSIDKLMTAEIKLELLSLAKQLASSLRFSQELRYPNQVS